MMKGTETKENKLGRELMEKAAAEISTRYESMAEQAKVLEFDSYEAELDSLRRNQEGELDFLAWRFEQRGLPSEIVDDVLDAAARI